MISLSFLLVFNLALYQLLRKRWLPGCLLLSLLFIMFFLLLIQIEEERGPRPTPSNLHYTYTTFYEDQENIELIIGVTLPEHEIINSRVFYENRLTPWIGIIATIRFHKPPDYTLYTLLDSLSSLPIPSKISEPTSYFYYDRGSIKRGWNKVNEKYKFTRVYQPGEKLMKSDGDCFNLSIVIGVDSALIEYGNNKLF